jgi:hypothetical protein
MSKIAVFGNGESRKSIDINKIRVDHILVGCNAIHRDFIMDRLVCCDRRMIEEAVENPNTKNTTIHVRDEQFHYFRKIKKNKKINLLPKIPYKEEKRPDQPNHWGSGPYAVLVACLLEPTQISLWGFDLISKNDFVNNVYKGTKNYKKINDPAVDPSYWIYQISKLFVTFPKIDFVIHNDHDWRLPIQWQQKNVEKVNTSCDIHKYLV